MADSTHLLAQIKLRETRRQRDRLHGLYDAIEARVAQAGSPLERLRALHAGLSDITFAQTPLHPDVAHLDALFLADELGTAPPELIDDRTRLLERELAQGRLRAEFTYVFGRILSEWTAPATGAAEPAEPAGDPLTPLWEEPPPLDRGFLDGVWQSLGESVNGVAQGIKESAGKAMLEPVGGREVTAVLERTKHDPYARPALRREAEAVLGSPTQVNEYAGVLT